MRILIVISVALLCWPVFANGYGEALKHVHRAEDLMNKKEWDRALGELDTAQKHNDKYGYYGYISYLRGKIFVNQGKNAEALEQMKLAMKYKAYQACGNCSKKKVAKRWKVKDMIKRLEKVLKKKAKKS